MIPEPPAPSAEFSCDWCSGDDSGYPGSEKRHHPYCVVAIEEGENGRIEALVDRERER